MSEDDQVGFEQTAVGSFEVAGETSPISYVETYVEGKMLGSGLRPEQLEEIGTVLVDDVETRTANVANDPTYAADNIEASAVSLESVEIAEVRETSGVEGELLKNADDLSELRETTTAQIWDVVKKRGEAALGRSRSALGALAAAGALSGDLPPQLPTLPNAFALVSATISPENTRNIEAINAAYEFESKRDKWHEEHKTSELMSSLRDTFYPLRELGGETKPIDSQIAERALRELKKIVGEYPAEFRGKAAEDTDLSTVVDLLQEIANAKGTESTDPKDKERRYEIQLKSTGLAYEAVHKFEQEYAESVKSTLGTKQEAYASLGLFRLKNHLDISRTMSDLNEDPAYLLGTLKIPDQMYLELKGHLDRSGATSEQLFDYLVTAGVKGAKDKVVSDILTRKIDLSNPKGLSRAHLKEIGKPSLGSLELGDSYGEARIHKMEHVGEDISAETLKGWQLDPSTYMPKWSNVDRAGFYSRFGPNGIDYAQGLVERNHQDNLRRIQQIEQFIPGGTEKLNTQYGIAFPARYPLPLLLQQLYERKEGKPYGAMLTAYADGTGAFRSAEAEQVVTDNMLHEGDGGKAFRDVKVRGGEVEKVFRGAKASGYSMRVIEAGDPLQAANLLLKLKEGSGLQPSFLGVRGHGEPESIALGNDNNSKITKSFFGLGSNTTSLILPQDAPIYFNSCSTGVEGGIAQQVSRERSGQVVAPNIPTNIEDIQLVKKDGKLSFNIRYVDFNKDRSTKEMRYEQGKLKQ